MFVDQTPCCSPTHIIDGNFYRLFVGRITGQALRSPRSQPCSLLAQSGHLRGSPFLDDLPLSVLRHWKPKSVDESHPRAKSLPICSGPRLSGWGRQRHSFRREIKLHKSAARRIPVPCRPLYRRCGRGGGGPPHPPLTEGWRMEKILTLLILRLQVIKGVLDLMRR